MNAFEGKENAISDTITFNAGVDFHLIGKTASIKEGVDLAYYSIKNGIVLDYLEILRDADHE